MINYQVLMIWWWILNINNEFYNNSDRICLLIEEINKITNKEGIYEGYKAEAPFVYTNGKCYYFARALHEIIPNSTLYETQNGTHIIIKIGEDFYDAEGLIYSYGYLKQLNPFPLDLNDDYDIDMLHINVANSYDDQYLLPRVIKIAKKADEIVKNRLGYDQENIKKKR